MKSRNQADFPTTDRRHFLSAALWSALFLFPDNDEILFDYFSKQIPFIGEVLDRLTVKNARR